MKTIIKHALVLGAVWLLAACHGGSDDDDTSPPPDPTGGLDARPSNTTCVAPDKSSSNVGTTIALQRVFAGITPALNQPLLMLQAPGDNARWYVLQKGTGSTAVVRVFANTPTVTTAPTAITLTVNPSSEGGLLGMAFHPSYATNHQVFLSFTEGSPMVSRVARFTTADNGATFDVGSRLDVISVNQPFDNHKGGNIAFGQDGNLYAGFGDGGSGDDPDGHGQNTKDLLGSMLRVNVDNAGPTVRYTIPSGNPFAANAMCSADYHVVTNDCPEIYAWGFRNPWRWSFDSANGDLWVADVGQGAYEEVDRVQAGGNYGWDVREGKHCHEPASGCSTSGLIDPVAEYDHSLGFSITGGFVYRGTALPALVGHYVYADYGSGRIWRLDGNSGSGYTPVQLLDTNLSIASFGQGNDGELYVVDIAGGGLYKIVDGGGGAPSGPGVATQLSATGCVLTTDATKPAAGMVPYDVAAPFWSDGATKERWLAIPNGTSIAVGSDGDFTFPNGSVLMKNFRLNGNLIETRLFMRHPDGDWAGYTYEWNAQHTDATLVPNGKTATIGSQDWIYPSGSECLSCHTSAAGFALGLETAELNHDFAYPGTGRTANQLHTLDEVVMFTTPLGDPALQPKLVDPADTTASLSDRARAYLHTNCSQCHRPNGPTSVSMDFRFSTSLANTAACSVAPTAGDLGIAGAQIIAPGNPDASVLVARMNRRGADQMPPLASNVIDTAGVTLLHDWIASLTTCN